MYLYIFEDGLVKQSSVEPTSDDKQNVDDGYLEIVKFSVSNFECYSNGAWVEVEYRQ